jgi:O-antigen/teichoic acid export membrane protein
LLGGFILPHDELAILGLCIRLAGIAGFVIQATQQFILPDLTHALTKKDDTTANSLLLRLNVMTIVTLGLGLSFAILLGGYFLSFFGEAYRAGQWLLVLFLCGQAIRAMSGMNQNLLSIAGQQVRSAGAAIVGLVLFAALWVVLAPRLGLMAAGVSVILAELAWALMLAAQAKAVLGRRADLLWLLTRRP